MMQKPWAQHRFIRGKSKNEIEETLFTKGLERIKAAFDIIELYEKDGISIRDIFEVIERLKYDAQ